MPNRNKGLYLALLTALISGISIFINKFAVASFENPIMLPTIKNSLVGFLLLSVCILSRSWQKTRSELRSLTKKQILQLVGVALVGGSVPFYLFFTGLSQIPAVNAAIIQKSLVIWVALLAIPLLKEKITKTQALAVLILFAGNLMVGGFKGLTLSKGEFMIFLATLSWAAETILVKKVLRSLSADVVTTARMGLGSMLLIFFSLITAPSDVLQVISLNSSQWFWITLTSVTLFAYVFTWFRALKLAPAITVSAVLVSSTLVTNVLSAIFITHTWNLILTQQGSLIIIGLLLLIRISKLQSHPNEPIMVK
ncbi:MAG: DMT family transporter [Patescibacteria group bacterium]